MSFRHIFKRTLSTSGASTKPSTPKTTVLKFGGSSVGSAKTIRKVGDIILAAQKNHGESRLVYLIHQLPPLNFWTSFLSPLPLVIVALLF
jgi:hypothetical protein